MKKLTTQVVSLLTAGISWVAVAHAQTPQQPIKDKSTLMAFFCAIIGWFIWIVVAISVIMILYAAFQYVTARDDVEKTGRARKTITYAAIGIAVALIAYGFPQVVASVFPSGASASSFTCSQL